MFTKLFKPGAKGKIISESSRKFAVFITGVTLFGHACTTEFKGTNTSGSQPNRGNENANSDLSPQEDENNNTPSETPAPKPEVCVDSHKAARIYFVVDNSNSHGYVVPGQALRQGTDPAREGLSARGITEFKTYRQEALYNLIKRAIELDGKAKKSKPDFEGTQLGLAYFPLYRGDGNPQNRYDGELEDLGKYVAVSGPSGISSSLFPSTLTDLSSLKPGPDLDDKLWNSLKFTHTPGGSTPYATGLRSAVENFAPQAQNPSDPKENIVMFITDGLPTDETPSAVASLKSQLGPKTQLVLLSVYDPNEDPTVTNSPLYSNLRAAFLGPTNWATKPGNPDIFPKTEAGFTSYWSSLVALPNKIADKVVKVGRADQLQGEMDKILQAATTCSR